MNSSPMISDVSLYASSTLVMIVSSGISPPFKVASIPSTCLKSLLNAKLVTMSRVKRCEWSSTSTASGASPAERHFFSHASSKAPTRSSTRPENCSSENAFMNGFWHILRCSRLYAPSEPVMPLFLITYRKASGNMRSL